MSGNQDELPDYTRLSHTTGGERDRTSSNPAPTSQQESDGGRLPVQADGTARTARKRRQHLGRWVAEITCSGRRRERGGGLGGVGGGGGVLRAVPVGGSSSRRRSRPFLTSREPSGAALLRRHLYPAAAAGAPSRRIRPLLDRCACLMRSLFVGQGRIRSGKQSGDALGSAAVLRCALPCFAVFFFLSLLIQPFFNEIAAHLFFFKGSSTAVEEKA